MNIPSGLGIADLPQKARLFVMLSAKQFFCSKGRLGPNGPVFKVAMVLAFLGLRTSEYCGLLPVALYQQDGRAPDVVVNLAGHFLADRPQISCHET